MLRDNLQLLLIQSELGGMPGRNSRKMWVLSPLSNKMYTLVTLRSFPTSPPSTILSGSVSHPTCPFEIFTPVSPSMATKNIFFGSQLKTRQFVMHLGGLVSAPSCHDINDFLLPLPPLPPQTMNLKPELSLSQQMVAPNNLQVLNR